MKGWLSLGLLAVTLVGEASPNEITAIEPTIAAHWRERSSLLQDYTCTSFSTVVVRNTEGKVESVTEIERRVYYRSPNQMRSQFVRATRDGQPIKEEDLRPGIFKVVPLFARRTGGPLQELRPEEIFFASRQNFRFHLLREERRKGLETWVIDVTPKEEKTWQRIIVWVDQRTLEVVRIEAESPADPSVFVKSTKLGTDFIQVADGIWLPGRAHTELEGRALFAGKRMEAVTRFTHYRINEGVDGKVFAR